MNNEPTTLAPLNDRGDWNTLPAELRDRKQIAVWRYEQKPGGEKPSKVPYKPVAPAWKASPTDSSTSGTFEAAVATYRGGFVNQQYGMDGIGHVLSAADPYAAVDLDHCRSIETGQIEPWAADIIEQLDSYTEINPSAGAAGNTATESVSTPFDNSIAGHPEKVAIYDKNGHVSTQPGLIRLSDVEPELVRWLWPGRIPLGKLTILDGDPGLGKSLMTLDIGARVTTGSVMPDGQASDLGAPAGVVLLSAEDDLADTIRPRLDAAGADVTRVVALTHVAEAGSERFPTVFDLPEIENAITAVSAALVIIDPIMAYLPSDVNSYRDQDVRRAFMPLTELAQRTGVAVLVIRHLNKQANSNPLYRGGGSIGMIGTARSGLLIAADPDDATESRRILVRMKSNSAAPVESLAYQVETAGNGVARIVWLGACRHTAHTVLAVPADSDDRSAIGEASAFLRNALQDGAQLAQHILTAGQNAGIAEKTLRRATTKMGIVKRREGFGPEGQWLWQLPGQPEQPKQLSSIDGQLAIDGHA
ncbi:MAG: AAA family ATPase [Chloroflexota bacterium]